MKKIVQVLLLIWSLNISAQVISSNRWTDLFSYNNILAIREDNGKLIAATENGIFYYTPATGEITKLSKTSGLHEVKISAFDYNPETKIGLVGYKSGALDVITPDGITYVVDIPIATGYMGNKKINHISITGNLAVISVGYGVSIFRLDRKEFADSCFFTDSGQFVASNEAILKDNKVYSVTTKGLLSHEMNVTFPIFSTWNTINSGTFTQIALSGSTIAYSNNGTVFYGNGVTFNSIPRSFTQVKDVVITPQNIVVTDLHDVLIYNLSGTQVTQMNRSENLNTGIFYGSKIYAGSTNAGMIDQPGNFLLPNGPYDNYSYKVSILNNDILVSTGNRESRFNTAAPNPKNLGFYYFNGTEWIYPSIFKNSSTIFNVLDAVQNPNDKTEVFFTNYTLNVGQGIYKMKYNATSKDFDLVKFYSFGNNIYLNRPVGLIYADNLLFATFSFYSEDNVSASNGYAVYNPTADNFSTKNLLAGSAVQKPFYSDGYLWIPSPRNNNFIAVNYKNSQTISDDETYVIVKDQGFPSNMEGSISFIIDKSGDGWIGTDNGLRILHSAVSEIKNTPTVEPIVIEENGLGEELFRDSSVLQIESDSGNQKWVSIDGGGVFYLSADAQNTIQHFTKENSPLPTNSITDVKVDNKTGKVYFSSFDGIVVYQGDVLDVTENFGDVLVYPNPVVYANYKGNVKIRGLAQKTNIRITDAAGNLVHQAVARGGYYEWNLNNHRGVRVASGIYFVLMTNADATDKATAKIAVVN